MPEFRDEDGIVYVWDPTSHSYVPKDGGYLGPDHDSDIGHAHGGDSNLFDTDDTLDGNYEKTQNPLDEGWASFSHVAFIDPEEDRGRQDCEYEFEGTDTDGTKWYRCKTHDELAPSPDAPCAGYVEEPYTPDNQPGDVTFPGDWNRTAGLSYEGYPITLQQLNGYIKTLWIESDHYHPGDNGAPTYYAKDEEGHRYAVGPDGKAEVYGLLAPDDWTHVGFVSDLPHYHEQMWGDLAGDLRAPDDGLTDNEPGDTTFPEGWDRLGNWTEGHPETSLNSHDPSQSLSSYAREAAGLDPLDPEQIARKALTIYQEIRFEYRNGSDALADAVDEAIQLLVPGVTSLDPRGEEEYWQINDQVQAEIDRIAPNLLDDAPEGGIIEEPEEDDPRRESHVKTASEDFLPSRQDITKQQVLEAIADLGLRVDEAQQRDDNHFAVTDDRTWIWLYFSENRFTGAETFGMNVGSEGPILEALSLQLDTDFYSEHSEEYWDLDRQLNPDYYDELAREEEHEVNEPIDPEIPDAPPEDWKTSSSEDYQAGKDHALKMFQQRDLSPDIGESWDDVVKELGPTVVENWIGDEIEAAEGLIEEGRWGENEEWTQGYLDQLHELAELWAKISEEWRRQGKVAEALPEEQGPELVPDYGYGWKILRVLAGGSLRQDNYGRPTWQTDRGTSEPPAEYYLMSPAQQVMWPVDGLQADNLPSKDNRDGIYVVDDPTPVLHVYDSSEFLQYGEEVATALVQCQIWGHCIRHKKGYRAEWAKPYAIKLRESNENPLIPTSELVDLEQVAKGLRAVYKCDVMVEDYRHQISPVVQVQQEVQQMLPNWRVAQGTASRLDVVVVPATDSAAKRAKVYKYVIYASDDADYYAVYKDYMNHRGQDIRREIGAADNARDAAKVIFHDDQLYAMNEKQAKLGKPWDKWRELPEGHPSERKPTPRPLVEGDPERGPLEWSHTMERKPVKWDEPYWDVEQDYEFMSPEEADGLEGWSVTQTPPDPDPFAATINEAIDRKEQGQNVTDLTGNKGKGRGKPKRGAYGDEIPKPGDPEYMAGYNDEHHRGGMIRDPFSYWGLPEKDWYGEPMGGRDENGNWWQSEGATLGHHAGSDHWPKFPPPGTWKEGDRGNWRCPNCNTPVNVTAEEAAPWNKHIHKGVGFYDWECPNENCNPRPDTIGYQRSKTVGVPQGTRGYYYPHPDLEPREPEIHYTEDEDGNRKADSVTCVCREEVPLWNYWANTCPTCGRDYDANGHMLAPRSQWGEETGEGSWDMENGFQSDFNDPFLNQELMFENMKPIDTGEYDDPSDRLASVPNQDGSLGFTMVSDEGNYVNFTILMPANSDISAYHGQPYNDTVQIAQDNNGENISLSGLHSILAQGGGELQSWSYSEPINVEMVGQGKVRLTMGERSHSYDYNQPPVVEQGWSATLDVVELSQAISDLTRERDEYVERSKQQRRDIQDLYGIDEHTAEEGWEEDDEPEEGDDFKWSSARRESRLAPELEPTKPQQIEAGAESQPEGPATFAVHDEVKIAAPLEAVTEQDLRPEDFEIGLVDAVTKADLRSKVATLASEGIAARELNPHSERVAVETLSPVMPDINYVLDYNPEDLVAGTWRGHFHTGFMETWHECDECTKVGTWQEAHAFLLKEARGFYNSWSAPGAGGGRQVIERYSALVQALEAAEPEMPFSAEFEDPGVKWQKWTIEKMPKTGKLAMPYHVAPRDERESIEQHGLKPDWAGDVYYWDTPEQAQYYGDAWVGDPGEGDKDVRDGYDIWHFDLEPNELPQDDPFFDTVDYEDPSDREEFGPMFNTWEHGAEPGAHMIQTEGVPPDRLKRITNVNTDDAC